MAITGTYVNANTFTIVDDQTTKFMAGRMVEIDQAGVYKYGTISGSSFGGGVTTITLKADADTLQATMSGVEYGIIGKGTNQSMPEHPHDGTRAAGGLLDHIYLISIGNNTHDDIDTHIDTFTTHSGTNNAHHDKYTNEEAQDAVGSILSVEGTVTVAYVDAGNTITISGSPHIAESHTHEEADITDLGDYATNTALTNTSGVLQGQIDDNITHKDGDGSDHADVAQNTSNITQNTTDIASVSGVAAGNTTDITTNLSLFTAHSGSDSAHHAKYTDEEAQDAIGPIMTGEGTVTVTYDDGTPSITISGSEHIPGGHTHVEADITDLGDYATNTDLTNVSGTADTNTTNIAQNTADITTVSGLTIDNTNDITQNTSDIATNSGISAGNTANITTNTNNITTNTTNIATNSGVGVQNATDITTNATNIATNSGVGVQNASDITDHLAVFATHSGADDAHHAKYTDEEAQDAVGNIMSGEGTVTVTYDDGGDTITISGAAGGGSGETNTMSNLGAGEGVYYQKAGVDFEMKSLIGGDNITLTSTTSGITISGGGGGAADHGDLTGLADDDHTQYILHTYGTGTNNIVGGANAGASMTNAGDTILLGKDAGESITDGQKNIFIGTDTGQAMTRGDLNVFIGYQTGANNTGDWNVAVGAGAHLGSGSADSNTLVGYQAGTSITTGDDNVFLGHSAGLMITGGGGNIGIGKQAGYNGASYNVCVGNQAGYNFTSGANSNTIIGAGAGLNINGGDYVVCLGRNAGPTANQSQKLYIDIEASDTPLIYGDFVTDEVRINGRLEVKEDIEITPAPASDHGWSGSTALMTVDVNTVGFGAALHIDTDGNLVDATASGSKCQYMAMETGTGSKIVLRDGFVRDDTWNWVVGEDIYLSEALGTLTQTAPTTSGVLVQYIGLATHADRMDFRPNQQPLTHGA